MKRNSVTSKLTLSTMSGKLSSEDNDALLKLEEDFKLKALKLLANYSDLDAQWLVTIKLRKIG